MAYKIGTIPLLKSIRERLTSDSVLMQLVRGVYDTQVPESNMMPYLTVSEITGEDKSTKTNFEQEYEVIFQVWVKDGGRQSVLKIISRVAELLQTELNIEGYEQQSVRVGSIKSFPGLDGYTYRGAVHFNFNIKQL